MLKNNLTFKKSFNPVVDFVCCLGVMIVIPALIALIAVAFGWA